VADAKQYDNYINGEWVAGADYSANINPSELSDTIGDYAKADLSQVNAAIDAARAAFPAWSTSGIQARHDSLDKVGTEILARREELGTLLAREEGKTKPEGIGEVTRAGNIFKFFAGECLRLSGETTCLRCAPGVNAWRSRAKPVGVVGLITPWNFPIAIPCVEDRAGPGLRQLRGAETRRPGAGLRLGAGRHHLPKRHSRPACSTW
jgi:acyl-CoA reductase-like NAD-dependent aldehyde dehydrogenase